MVVRTLGEEPTRLTQEPGEGFVGIEDLQTRDVSDLVQKASSVIDRNNDRNSCLGTGDLVIFAICRRLVNDSRSLSRCDIVGHQNPPSVGHVPLVAIGVVVKNSAVMNSTEFGPGELPGDRRTRLGRILIPQLFAVVANGVQSQQVLLARL